MDYRQYAIDAAQKRGLNPHLFTALIEQESGWNPSAVSHKGAQGLGQAMPDTARDPGFGVTPLTNPNDPYAQIDFSADYLDAMLKFNGGDPLKALASYNWGAGRVQNWDGNFNSLPGETQNYILNISTKGGPMAGLPPPERIKVTSLDTGQTPTADLARMAQMGILSTGAMNVTTPQGPQGIATGMNPGMNPGMTSGPQGLPLTNPTQQPQPTGNSFMDRLLPGIDQDGRNARLLAIGSGLLSGDDWSSGFAGAAENLFNVGMNEQETKRAEAGADRGFQERLILTQMDQDFRGQQAAQSGGNRYDGQTFNIVGRDPNTNQELVRQAVMKGGVPHVYDDSGNLIPAGSMMKDFRIAGRNEAQDVQTGAGGVPNATSISADGFPAFKFQRESEAKFYGYALRALQADRDIDQIMQTVPASEMTSLESGLRRWAASNPDGKVSTAVINSILDDSGVSDATKSAMQQYLQAILRADTGAAYSGLEMADYASAFLPNTGDDAETQAYKRNLRRDTIGALAGTTGAAAPWLLGVMAGEYELPGKSYNDSRPAPTATTPVPTGAPSADEIEDILTKHNIPKM